MTPPDIPNDQHRVDSTEIAFVRLEGMVERGFDRVSSEIGHLSKNVEVIRQRQHDQANDIHSLLILNIPEKLTDLRAKQTQHDADIDALKSDLDQRKGMVFLARGIWAVVALLGIGGIAALLKWIVT